MRFKALRAKKWWLETIQFLNSIRITHKLPATSACIYDEIEKRNIEPLQLTRISSPAETARTSTRRHPRRTYPLSVGCIDFETDTNLLSHVSPIRDDHFIELQKKFRHRKKMKNIRKQYRSLTELHKMH